MQTDDRFNAKLTTGPTGEMGVQYARTGCLGFIKRTDFTQTDGGGLTVFCFMGYFAKLELFYRAHGSRRKLTRVAD